MPSRCPLSDWPALRSGLLGCAYRPELGIYGKVHVKPTDYRWIGMSAGLHGRARELERALAAGAVDGPVTAWFWRILEDGTRIAGLCTPTRSTDKAGRSAVIERQALVVPRDDVTNPLAVAVGLFAAAAALPRERWWARRGDPSFDDPTYVWTIPDAEIPEVRLDEDALGAHLARGCALLAESPGRAALEQFYLSYALNRLSLDRTPAVLQDARGPLAWEALVALLLPLLAEDAALLSAAGWTLSPTNRSAALAANWQIQVRPTGWSGAIAAPAGAAVEEWASRAAEAIVRWDPSLLVEMPGPEDAAPHDVPDIEPDPPEPDAPPELEPAPAEDDGSTGEIPRAVRGGMAALLVAMAERLTCDEPLYPGWLEGWQEGWVAERGLSEDEELVMIGVADALRDAIRIARPRAPRPG